MAKYKAKFKTVKSMVDEIVKGVMVVNEFNNETYYYSDENHKNKILRNFVPDEYKYREFPPIFQEPMSIEKFTEYLEKLFSTYDDLYDEKGYIKHMKVIYIDFDSFQ